jgi:hypothetical protein
MPFQAVSIFLTKLGKTALILYAPNGWARQSRAMAVNYARNGEFHIAYQVVGNGPIDLSLRGHSD